MYLQTGVSTENSNQPVSLQSDKSLFIGLDKGGYPVNIFLISPLKHMLWVLIRRVSVRRF